MKLKNNKSIEEADMVCLVSNDQPSFVVMSGACKGLKIDLNNIEDTINKLPGVSPLYNTFRELMS